MDEVANWVEIDEDEDVAASVRHALRCQQFIASDGQTWKWIALALHSALQGACVCHLVTSASPVGVVTDRNAGEWLAYFKQCRSSQNVNAPATYLLPLPDLLKKLRKPNTVGDGSASQGIFISDVEINWLIRFNDDIRNQFVHFEPKVWSIEVSGMPEIAKLITRLIGDILNTGYAFRHKDAKWK